MFDAISQFAERAATSASRREFLGALGRAAMAAAAAAAGILVMATDVAHAKRPVRACDANSTTSCLGRNVGDSCQTGPYGGRCRTGPGSKTPESCFDRWGRTAFPFRVKGQAHVGSS